MPTKQEIENIANDKKYCELCGSLLDHHELPKIYKSVEIVKKICEFASSFPRSFETLALHITRPGLTHREYAEILGISKMAVSYNLARCNKKLGMKINCPKFKNNVAQQRRRGTLGE